MTGWDQLAREWVYSAAPVLSSLSARQRDLSMALNASEHLRGASYAFDWSLHDSLTAELRSTGRFDCLVMIANSGATVSAGDIPMRLLARAVDPSTDEVDDDRLVSALDDLAGYITSDDITVMVRTELFGFDTPKPFEINDHLRISANTGEPTMLTTALYVPQGRYCLEATRASKMSLRKTGDIESRQPRADGTFNELISESQYILEAIMLLGEASYFTPGTPTVAYDSWVPLAGFQARPLRPVFPTGFERFNFPEASIEELRELVESSGKVQGLAKQIPVALHRFYLAKLRGRDDDRLIDLMIAAEALFLQDGRPELSYRLATRAAVFLADTREARVEVFNVFREAYELRSQIVHGSTLRLTELRRSLRQVEIHLQVAIRKAISLVNAGRAHAVNEWDRFAFLEI